MMYDAYAYIIHVKRNMYLTYQVFSLNNTAIKTSINIEENQIKYILYVLLTFVNLKY